jgi:precorrin-3B synthase
VNAPYRRGACPGLSAPMSTGDGLLVRLMPTDPIPLDAWIGFCAAARRHGNGTIEISARGSLQVRGLTPRSAPFFAATIAAVEVAAHDGVPVVADPLEDDPAVLIETADIAAKLRDAIARAKLALSAKLSVVVDGGGHLHLDGMAGDVRLRAIGPAAQPRFYVGVGGDGASAAWLGSIAPSRAADVVVGLLETIASRGPAARAADILRAEGIRAFRSVVEDHLAPASTPTPRPPVEMIGLHPVRDGRFAVGIALAFGHADADALAELARVAAAHGARSARPAPGRALLLIAVARPHAARLTAAAEQLGFVVAANDPRRRIVACPGAPACASGLIPARALAASLASTLPADAATATNAVIAHISGCPKGCAHPAATALTVIGTDCGCGIVHGGSARTPPQYHVEPGGLAAEMARIGQIGGARHG